MNNKQGKLVPRLHKKSFIITTIALATTHQISLFTVNYYLNCKLLFKFRCFKCSLTMTIHIKLGLPRDIVYSRNIAPFCLTA